MGAVTLLVVSIFLRKWEAGSLLEHEEGEARWRFENGGKEWDFSPGDEGRENERMRAGTDTHTHTNSSLN